MSRVFGTGNGMIGGIARDSIPGGCCRYGNITEPLPKHDLAFTTEKWRISNMAILRALPVGKRSANVNRDRRGDEMAEGEYPAVGDPRVSCPPDRGMVFGAWALVPTAGCGEQQGRVACHAALAAEPEPGSPPRLHTQRNLTGASLLGIRRHLVVAWRLMLAAEIDAAFHVIEQIELALGDLPSAVVERFEVETELLRAAGLAFRDDSLATLSIAQACLKKGAGGPTDSVASMLCGFGYWQLGEFDRFYARPRHWVARRSAKRQTVSAAFELAIEAAVELDRLHVATAKRLAFDALGAAAAAARPACASTALAACVAAQVLYEEGNLDEAHELLHGRRAAVETTGSVECALRSYLVLARIARHRMQHDFAALLLREAETLGVRRGWPRLVAASLAERAAWLLQDGRADDARCCADQLDHYAQMDRSGGGHYRFDVMCYRMLTRSRIRAAEHPTAEAVAALRLIYHQTLTRQGRYAGCRLAVELAGWLAAIGEQVEADALFAQTLCIGASAGLYQTFVDGGDGTLLKRAYEQASRSDSSHRTLLPYIGSLLACRVERDAQRFAKRPAERGSDVLSPRERDILKLIGRGLSNKRIALMLAISPETVKSHVKRIFVKLAVTTRIEAVSRAGALGLL